MIPIIDGLKKEYRDVTGRQTIMKAIIPSAVDGDLLKLVHLSNGFKMISGSRPPKAGDVCRAEARVVGVVNGDSGKTVRASGRILCKGNPVMKVPWSLHGLREHLRDDW